MEIEQSSFADYQKGFNEAYLIAKYLPELSARLDSIKNEIERIEGFHDGRKQLVRELAREQRPSWMNIDQKPNPAKDLAKDDIEPDRS